MNQIDTNDFRYVKERGYKPLGWIPGAVDQETGKINPQVTKLYLGGTQFISVFHVKPIYYETTAGTWRPMSEICSHHGNKRIELNTDWRKAAPRFIDWLTKRQALFGQDLLLPTPFGFIPSQYQDQIRPTISIGLTTTTVYPDPSVETTTVDGAVGSRDADYATMRTGASLTASDSSTIIAGHYVVGLYYLTGGVKYRSDKGFYLFDTSAIDSGDTIDSATLSITPDLVLNQSTGDNNWFLITQSTPASNTAIATGDWGNCGDATQTVGGSAQESFGSISAATEYDVVLNATGEGYITKAGITKLGMRGGDESSGTAPTGLGNAQANGTQIRSADYAGTTSDPKLVVVHSVAVTALIKSVNGLAKASIKSWNGVILA